MSQALSQGVRTFVLVFGVVEALGATVWCCAGAGVYGSPLAQLTDLALAHVLLFLLIGPFSALFASVVALWRPRWGAACLVVGGIVSGVLAMPFIVSDAFILPLAFVSVPMALLGRWLFRTSRRPASAGEQAKPVVERRGQRIAGIGSVLLGVLHFLIAFFGVSGLFVLLAVNNVTGLRGPPHSLGPNPLVTVYENENLADGIVLLLVAAVAGMVTFMRKRLLLRVEALAGIWFALLLVGIALLMRSIR